MIDYTYERSIGLSEDEVKALRECYKVRRDTQAGNYKRSAYHDSKQLVKDFGISIPPSLRGVNAALGWPARAVKAMSRKHDFQGFSARGDSDPFDMSEVLAENQFDLELMQGFHSSYKHSCAFLVTTHGDTSIGEPELVIQARDAENTFAVWDKRRRVIRHALAISASDEDGEPTEATLFMWGKTIAIVRSGGFWRPSHRWEHPSDRALIEPLPVDPQLNRPFGRSVITREVRYLTDEAIRTMLRASVSAEFFAAPQRYVLGADEDAFKNTSKWKAVIGRLLALSTNEEGDKPTVGQFPAHGPREHLDLYRQLAQNFCAATGLPQSQVGIFADNPASAEAMNAAEAALAEDVEYQWRIARFPLLRTLQNGVMLRDGEAPRSEVLATTVNWTPARYVSPQAASDWAIKAVSADPTLQGTNIIRRRLGLSQGELEELESSERRRNAPSVLAALGAANGGDLNDDTGGDADPSPGERAAGQDGAPDA